MNKDNIYKIAKIIVFITLALFILMKFDNVLSYKYEASNQLYPYYKEKTELDVVFAGTSQGAHGFNTMYLWNEFGITSYNRADSAQHYKNSYYIIKEAIRIKKPKVIVLDVHYLLHLQDLAGASIKLYNMHVSQDRYDGFKDIFPSKKLNEFLSYHQFHTRWKVLQNYDFYIYPSNVFKGYTVHDGLFISNYPKIDKPENKDLQSLLDDTILYTNKIVTLCKENNVHIVFVKLPQVLDNLQKSRNKLFGEYCKKNNITFIDFNDLIDNIGIDFNKDFHDPYHLTIYGAEKVTSYLGKYIKDNYNIADKRGNKNYNDWNNEIDFEYTKDLSDTNHINLRGEKILNHHMPYIIENYNISNKKNDKEYAFWNDDFIKYSRVVNAKKIKYVNDFKEWWNYANYDNYTILISVKGENVLKRLPDNIRDKFKSIGLLKYETNNIDDTYAAIIDNNQVFYEYIYNKQLGMNGRVNNKFNMEILSDKDNAIIYISGKQVSKNQNGLNFVVYDNINREVVDSMWVDPEDFSKVRR